MCTSGRSIEARIECGKGRRRAGRTRSEQAGMRERRKAQHHCETRDARVCFCNGGGEGKYSRPQVVRRQRGGEDDLEGSRAACLAQVAALVGLRCGQGRRRIKTIEGRGETRTVLVRLRRGERVGAVSNPEYVSLNCCIGQCTALCVCT